MTFWGSNESRQRICLIGLAKEVLKSALGVVPEKKIDQVILVTT